MHLTGANRNKMHSISLWLLKSNPIEKSILLPIDLAHRKRVSIKIPENKLTTTAIPSSITNNR